MKNWRTNKTEWSRSIRVKHELTETQLRRLKSDHADGVPLAHLKKRFGLSEERLREALRGRA